MSSSTVHIPFSYLELHSSNYRLRLIKVRIKKQEGTFKVCTYWWIFEKVERVFIKEFCDYKL